MPVLTCSNMLRFAPLCSKQDTKKHQNLMILMLDMVSRQSLFRVRSAGLVIILSESRFVEAYAIGHPHPDEFRVGD